VWVSHLDNQEGFLLAFKTGLNDQEGFLLVIEPLRLLAGGGIDFELNQSSSDKSCVQAGLGSSPVFSERLMP
jgi:hypothetical protein